MDFLYKYRIPVLILSAALTGLTLVCPTVGFLEWISIIPGLMVLYMLAKREKFKFGKMYAYGLVFFGSFYLVDYHWFWAMYPMDFLGVDKASSIGLIILCWVGLSLFQTAITAFAFPLFCLICRCNAVKRKKILMPFIISAVWTVFEWIQTHGWIGVPLCRLCLGQAKYLAILQTASLFGSYFVTFLLICFNGLLAYAILGKEKIRLCAGVAAGLFIANLLTGIILMATYQDSGESVTAAGIQGNVSSLDRWTDGMQQKTYDAYDELSRQAAEEGAEIIVWPETAFPYVYNTDGNTYSIPSNIAKDCNVTVYAGMFYKDVDGKYNAVIQFNPDGSISDNMYYKRHLVPFGEYIPMKGFIVTVFPTLTKFMRTELEPGTESSIYDTEYGKIGAIICFDSIYENLSLDAVRNGAELIILGTNDSWFFDSAAAYMHNSQAQLRAIETGRYIVRAANTGYSTVIKANGEIIADTEILEEGFVIADVYFRDNTTLYTLVGNLFVYICIAFSAAIPLSQAVLSTIKKRNNHKKNT